MVYRGTTFYTMVHLEFPLPTPIVPHPPHIAELYEMRSIETCLAFFVTAAKTLNVVVKDIITVRQMRQKKEHLHDMPTLRRFLLNLGQRHATALYHGCTRYRYLSWRKIASLLSMAALAMFP